MTYSISILRTWLRRLIALLIVVLLGRVVFCERFEVSSDSMLPALKRGDSILVDKQVYEWRTPRRWEVIVFCGPEYRPTPHVKRVVGLPGETIEIRGGQLIINGQPVVVPVPVNYQPLGRHGITQPCRLSADEYFVLGDNGPESNDSRHWPDPAVKMSDIIGRKLP